MLLANTRKEGKDLTVHIVTHEYNTVLRCHCGFEMHETQLSPDTYMSEEEVKMLPEENICSQCAYHEDFPEPFHKPNKHRQ